MKYLSLALIILSFSAFAKREDVPCRDDQNICTYKTWSETFSFQSKKIYSKGIGATYASAEQNAAKRLETAYKGIQCGTFGYHSVHHQELRLRDGRMGFEVWIRCNPDADAYKNQGTSRSATTICSAGQRGCLMVK